MVKWRCKFIAWIKVLKMRNMFFLWPMIYVLNKFLLGTMLFSRFLSTTLGSFANIMGVLEFFAISKADKVLCTATDLLFLSQFYWLSWIQAIRAHVARSMKIVFQVSSSSRSIVRIFTASTVKFSVVRGWSLMQPSLDKTSVEFTVVGRSGWLSTEK